MQLHQVRVEAYRSLYDVVLKPASFTVLVGPNNAGKTNVSGSLEFLGQLARHGLEIAISREGGFENLAFRRARRTRKPVKFGIAATMAGSEIPGYYPSRGSRAQRLIGNAKIALDYSFELRASSESRDADFRVTQEDLSMQVSAGEMEALLTLERREGSVKTKYDGPGSVRKSDSQRRRSNSAIEDFVDLFLDPFHIESFGAYLESTIDPTALVINRSGFNQIIRYFLNELGRTRLFQLTPVECRRTGAATPNPDLARHGGNLPAVVRYMQRNHEEAWGETLTAMRGIMPGLTAIETEFTASRRLSLLFHERGARPWTSDDVSDGTIQSLALFTCLFDPRVPLVLIEEPENSIHPWIVKRFVDACRGANKQVLLTTHSPALISYLEPRELEVIWRDGGGRTKIADLDELDPEASGLWVEGKLDLYELIDGGWIRQSVPPGLQ